MVLNMTKLGIIFGAEYVAVTQIIDEVADTATKVGTLGMQGLLAFLLIILFVVIYYQEKRRTEDRNRRDAEQEARFNAVMRHHDESVEKFNTERSAFVSTLVSINEKSVAAMEGMTVAMEGFKEWLSDRAIDPYSRVQRQTAKPRTKSK